MVGNQFLVIYKIDDTICEPEITNAYQIFDKMDMSDCYDICVYRLYHLDKDKAYQPIECEFYGTWHVLRDPLLMEIKRKSDGATLDFGYGTDH